MMTSGLLLKDFDTHSLRKKLVPYTQSNVEDLLDQHTTVRQQWDDSVAVMTTFHDAVVFLAA